MAAYAAVVSLIQLLNPDQFPVRFRKPEIESLHKKLLSLQSTLEKIFPVHKNIRPTVNKLDTDIRDDIYEAQDLIESFVLEQSLINSSESEAKTKTFLLDLQKIEAKLDPKAEEAEKIADSIKDDGDAGDISSENDLSTKSTFSTQSTKIIGQEADFELITTELMKESSKLQVLPIIGLPGIGKTTLARSIYDNPEIQSSFPTRAWVTVSQDSHVVDIFTKLLSSMESKGQKAGDRVVQGSVDQLSLQLHQSLFSSKYLVVVDDMWEEGVWDKVKQYLPDEKNGSRIILTTRHNTIAEYANPEGFCHTMSPLSPENSWILLHEKAFGGGPGLDNLEKIGRRIANNCDGLPLSLTVIGGLLFQGRKTEDYWKSIEEDTYDAAGKGKEAYLEILSLSYSHLPGRLKGCFLYMGAFPEDSELLVSKLVKLWVAEGFLKPSPNQNHELVAKLYLVDLVNRNLLSIRKYTSNGETKALGMHDSLRDLAVNKCRNEKFFHAINRYVKIDQLPKGTDAQRRLSVHKNILVCMKDVYDSAKSLAFSRSLLFPGTHHHHPLPYSLTFNLLRVLDAFTVYFIEFPNEVLELIHLRYLSLTYNGKLPSELSKLEKLQVLIVRRHPKIIFIGASIFPAEIWNMPQLRHLLFTESELPSGIVFNQNSVLLRNLQSLSNVNAASCTREALQNMPNLKKLGMWVEKPADVGLYLDELNQLEAFKFTVLNPLPKEDVNFVPKLFFPETIKRLTLSGCGIKWAHMTVIGQLPSLEVLKLMELACKGEEWTPNEGEFLKLKFLKLEYVDLKYWDADQKHFPSLERLIIRHCYELEAINPDIRMIGGLKLIEMVDCSPDAVEWANEVKAENNNKNLQVRIYTSWE